MDIWNQLNNEEREWIKNAGYDLEDVNQHSTDDTINFLWGEYASRGYILADAQAMAERLKNI